MVVTRTYNNFNVEYFTSDLSRALGESSWEKLGLLPLTMRIKMRNRVDMSIRGSKGNIAINVLMKTIIMKRCGRI